MADSLRTRVGRIVAGGAHAFLDKIEDAAPEAMMEQSIRNVEVVIDEVRGELGKVTANRHLAQQQHALLNKNHEALSEQLEHAIGAARDDLARASVGRQLDIEVQLPVLEKTMITLGNEEAELKGYVEALLAKKREMQDALNSYRSSRESVAATAISSAANLSRVENATNAFDRVFSRQTGMSVLAHGASLEEAQKLKELDDMVRQNKISERLARLKAEKGDVQR